MESDKLKETYNKIAKDWHKDHKKDNWWIGATDKFISLLNQGDLVLDAGCAGGVKSKYLSERGLRVVGIDFAENFIEIAKREIPGGEFLVLDVRDIDKLEAQFDGIFMQAVLLHLPKDEAGAIIKNATSKLKIGGYFYVSVKEKIEGGLDSENKKESDYGYEYERYFSYFTREDLRSYFAGAGLDVIYEDVLPPTSTTHQSNWMQMIGKKIK